MVLGGGAVSYEHGTPVGGGHNDIVLSGVDFNGIDAADDPPTAVMQRENFVLTTYWFKSTYHRDD